MAVMISTEGLAGAQLSEGSGPAACLKKNGTYRLKTVSAKLDKSEAGNVTMSLTQLVQDDDAVGAVLYKNMTLTGKITKGDNAGKDNIAFSGLGQLILSSGRSPEYLAGIVAAKQFDAEKLMADLMAPGFDISYAFVTQGQDFNGNDRSEPRFYVSKDRYEKAQASGANWRVDPKGARRPAGTNGIATGTVTTAVTDAIASDV